MAQHDYVIANANGATVRADINNALLAISSTNSGTSEPSTMYAYEMWVDTSNSLLKLRNAANNAWITLGVSITASNTVDIDGGAIDGTPVGASSASTGAFSTITSTVADNSDNLTLTSTDADANSGPNLRLYRNSGSPADDDALGWVEFEGRNDNSQDVIYGSIYQYASDVSDGTEDGAMYIKTMLAGTLRSTISLLSAEVVFNDDSQDVDFRVESDGNTHMLFIDAGNDRVGIATDSPATTVDIRGTVNVGIDDTGYDVKFFGATASAYMLWDESEDDLILGGAARVVVPDGQLVLASTAISSTAAEINLLDGLDRGSIIYGNASSVTTILGQGTADQVLTSDGTDISWEDASGGGGGKVLQVLTATGGAEIMTSGTMNSTGLYLAITPAATSSKILAIAMTSGTYNNGTGGVTFGIFRGDSGEGSGSVIRSGEIMGTSGNQYYAASVQVLDSPSSTDEQTYTVMHASTNGSSLVGWCGTGAAGSDVGTLVLMEIGA